VKNKLMVYNLDMPKRIKLNTDDFKTSTFGKRLASLRKKAGLSQRDLAKELGISQRMIAYYEKQTDFPPTQLLPAIVKVLGVSSDQLLGIEKEEDNIKDQKLWQRFKEVQELSKSEKKSIFEFLDTFIDRKRLLNQLK
jgi:transcriptional regulator with XRE-family HTH domain